MNGRDRIDERCERLLDEWLAGDLAPGSDAERALLAHDPGLLDELERHRALRAAVRELPAELEPGRDLWPGVAARIAPSARRRRVLPWRAGAWRPAVALPAAALAATLAVALGTALLRWDRTPGESPAPAAAVAPRAAAEPAPETVPSLAPGVATQASSPAPAGDPVAAAPPAPRRRAPAALPASTSTPAVLVAGPPEPERGTPGGAVPALAAYAETDRELAALGAELRRTIEERQERLPPETRRIVFDNLATIERALAEIEVALAGAPGDVELARTYIEYRQREITVLRRANAMAARL